MILPVPTPTKVAEDDFRLINLEKYEYFFSHLDRGFPSNTRSILPMARVDSAAKSQLKVHKVGSFVASIVPTLSDFSRLDPQFSIAPETWTKIPGYDQFSFIVFQLAELAATTHPMAFEFPSSLDSQIFFPTVHIHDGEVHDKEEFDHTLYLQSEVWDAAVGSYDGPKGEDSATKWTRSRNTAESFMAKNLAGDSVDLSQLVHRKTVRGMFKNEDFVVSNSSIKLPPRMNLFPWLAGGAGLLAMTSPLMWLMARRSKLMSGQSPETIAEGDGKMQ